MLGAFSLSEAETTGVQRMERVDAVVIGAGVVGLAVACELALQGREVVVLERESTFGSITSARNSEVIHAGIYYPVGSLKARLCVDGRERLYAYCAERSIAHKRCGKLIVATTDAQRDALPGILQKASVNGVHDLRLLDAAEVRSMEPALEGLAAVYSPSTGIVDSHGLMLSLLGDLEHAGGMLVCHSPVVQITVQTTGLELVTADGTTLLAQTVINAAGLDACDLAGRTVGLSAGHVPQPSFAKGNYFTLSGRAPFTHLIYPAPEPQAHLAGLGVHLTLDLGGQAKFGPDVQWVDRADDCLVDASRLPAFEAAIRRYWPGLPAGALQPGYAGVRPKINGPDEPAADFRVDTERLHGVAGLVNLFGIESPGLTSALAMGKYVAEQLSMARG
jgi:L-2-hydroxyglutarate oxidase LhgO